ncbi:ATP-binding cassette domain-containing protein [Mycoplasma phocoenae]|uniref:ATP-binding cassette domain-containing protein n=1 Tax=Mycoplasma phocoenae TaxID=754517 RepID=A0A858U308_9MOLU|nr:ATP-binding cassette domain-containing protein [Mycoplasma phocoenae]QJG66860.1 ATP-binding cassette domain-containing protein [Mycoplasma phocoenae]
MKNNNSEKKVILEIDNLKKYFINGNHVNKAVDGVSFKVHEGEVVGLIGESGSGKTTIGRSLLRLYDEYNGFVRLDKKIISGKKISNKRNKFLRRNVQMIFQDPHASLNGQKTIFSTLKEPLVVNKIMKENISDLFSDWKDVKSNFKYTFRIKTKTLEIENLGLFNKLAENFVKEWTKNFEEIQFNSSLNLEDNFNLYYAFLEEKQIMESDIIDKMYSNTTKLIEYYKEKQKEFRSNILTEDEILVNNLKKQHKDALLGSKLSKKQVKQHYELIDKKAELDDFETKLHDFKLINKNTFKNYIQEFKHEIKLIKNNRLSTTDLDFYAYNLKRELLDKHTIKYIKDVQYSLRYLTFNQIKEFIQELKLYTMNFYTEFLSFDYQPKLKQKINKVIDSDFKFDCKKFVATSKENEDDIKKDQKRVIDTIAHLEKELKKQQKPFVCEHQLAKIEQELSKALIWQREELDKFVEHNKAYVATLDEEIVKINKIYYDLRDEIKQLTHKFDKKHTEFIEFIKHQASLDKTKIKFWINKYNTIVQNKFETQKSFNIEYKYLLKDIGNIDLLLGNNKSIINRMFNNKAKTFDKIYSHFLMLPVTKLRIQGLLYKTIIYKTLEDVGLLKQFAYRYPHEFSGGQRQRIVIARALITNPKIIVADEPIASLDISIQAQVVNLLKDLCKTKNIGLIFIAHDLSMIEYVADRVQIMHLGKIVESGDTEAIYKNPVHPYTINLFKAIPKISNANEKFENISFELNYLSEQKFPFIPKEYKVEEDHYVYGTEEQVYKWVSEQENPEQFNIESVTEISLEEVESSKKKNKK